MEDKTKYKSRDFNRFFDSAYASLRMTIKPSLWPSYFVPIYIGTTKDKSAKRLPPKPGRWEENSTWNSSIKCITIGPAEANGLRY